MIDFECTKEKPILHGIHDGKAICIEMEKLLINLKNKKTKLNYQRKIRKLEEENNIDDKKEIDLEHDDHRNHCKKEDIDNIVEKEKNKD